MRKILMSVLCLSLFVGVGALNAQKSLSKEEQKQWKKTAKEYAKNPEALAQLTKEKQELQRINNSLESDMNLLQTQVAAKDNRIANLEAQVERLQFDLQNAQTAQPPAEPAYVPTDNGSEVLPMGTIFRVQIGAFEQEKNQLPSDLNTTNNLDAEQSGGLQKIVLGQFTNKADADRLKQYLRKVGLKDAWVVEYRDGVRVN